MLCCVALIAAVSSDSFRLANLHKKPFKDGYVHVKARSLRELFNAAAKELGLSDAKDAKIWIPDTFQTTVGPAPVWSALKPAGDGGDASEFERAQAADHLAIGLKEDSPQKKKWNEFLILSAQRKPKRKASDDGSTSGYSSGQLRTAQARTETLLRDADPDDPNKSRCIFCGLSYLRDPPTKSESNLQHCHIVPIGDSAALHGLALPPPLDRTNDRNHRPNILTLCEICHRAQGKGLAWINPNGTDDRARWTLAISDHAPASVKARTNQPLFFTSDASWALLLPTRAIVDWAVKWAAAERSAPRKTTTNKEETATRKKLKVMCKGKSCSPDGGSPDCPCVLNGQRCGLVPKKQCGCGCTKKACLNRSGSASAAAEADDSDY